MITALKDPKNKLILDWSPKAGCTILTKMFFRQMGLLEEALEYNSWIHEYRMHVYSKNYPITIDDLKGNNYYKIKVVRNPFHRAVSSYIHTMKYEMMHAPVKKTLWRWNANISFETFINYLSKIDLRTCDPHYSLQKKDYEYEIPGCFDEIISLKDIRDAFQNLNETRGTHFDLTGLTSSHHSKLNTQLNENVSGKKWSKLKDAIPDYKYFYTDNLIDQVYSLYADDFADYGFSKSDI
ncbi:MAG TPA: sulfotransferase family 2 domain-containing protein [Bacteroidia bacterium]|nr:sulfotransferase family 2 domain-containing protein [Bacteroidia bacterium]